MQQQWTHWHLNNQPSQLRRRSHQHWTLHLLGFLASRLPPDSPLRPSPLAGLLQRLYCWHESKRFLSWVPSTIWSQNSQNRPKCLEKLARRYRWIKSSIFPSRHFRRKVWYFNFHQSWRWSKKIPWNPYEKLWLDKSFLEGASDWLNMLSISWLGPLWLACLLDYLSHQNW